MSFYANQLLPTSPSLIENGYQMENNGLNNIGNSVVNSFNNLSQYKQAQENNAYQNILMKHLMDFQHQNQGTQNERINPYATSNGIDISSYLQNPSQYVNGMTNMRAGSIWNKFMQERENIANNKQNLLNSNIKNTAQQQYNIMQNYINKVGDTNKDGFVDIKDLNPTEQTALNGLYGSVANQLLKTAQQHQDLLSKLNLQNKYATEKQNNQYAYQNKIMQQQNDRSILSSYQTLYNKAYNDYLSLSKYDPSTMTPDMKQKLESSITQMNMYKNNILNLQSNLMNNQEKNNTKPILNSLNNNISTNNQNQNIANNILNKVNNNSSQNIYNKIVNPVNKTQTINKSIQSKPIQQKINSSMLNNPNGTIADNEKIINNAQNALNNYNTIKKYSSKNPYFIFAEPDVSKTYSQYVKPQYAIKTNPALLSNTINTVEKRLNYLQKVKYDKNIGLTPRLYAKMQISKLENALDYAKKHNIKMGNQAQTLLKNLQFYANQPISNLQSNNNIISKSLNSLYSTEIASSNLVDSLLGNKERAVEKTPHPYNTNYTLIDLGKLLLKTNNNYANQTFGDKGIHFSTTASDNYSKQIGENALPQIKTYLAQKLHISPSLLNNDDVTEWLYYQIGDPEANQLDVVGSLSRMVGVGGLNDQQANKKGVANLQNFLNSLKTIKK